MPEWNLRVGGEPIEGGFNDDSAITTWVRPPKHHNPAALIPEFASRPLAMEAKARDAFFARLAATPTQSARVRSESRMTRRGSVAEIPITGTLIKSIRGLEWLRDFGFDITGYDEIRDDLAQAMSETGIEQIEFAVSSPGGFTAGAKETADAIHAARSKKHVTARVDEMCASAAYWLASQADHISAGRLDFIGSIGCYLVAVDSSRAAENAGIKVNVIASGELKGAGTRGSPITEPMKAELQELVDGIAAQFVADIARGRGVTVAEVEKWASGRVWLAADARGMGLIDRLDTERDNSSPGVRAAATETQEDSMTDAEKKAAEDRARAEAQAAEKQRRDAITAAFPEDPAFALKAIGADWSVEKAQAEYAGVLRTRLAAEETKRKDAEAKLATAKDGPDAVPVGADPEGAAAQQRGKGGPAGLSESPFLKSARADQIEHIKSCAEHVSGRKSPCCSMTAAMSRVSRGHRQAEAAGQKHVFSSHLEASIADGPRHTSLKRELGVR